MKLNYSDGSIYAYLKETSRENLDDLAYIYFSKQVTFGGFIDDINHCAKGLREIGVKAGDVVSICMPNTPEGITVFYAVNMLGCVANMIHPLSAKKEMEYYLAESSSKYLFILDSAWNNLGDLSGEVTLENIVVISATQSLMPSQIGERSADNILFWPEFTALADGSEISEQTLEVKANRDERAVILYSGGTTGVPKGIVLSHLNFNALALQSYVGCGNVKRGDKILSILPIFHGFGLGIGVHTLLCVGGTLILVPKLEASKFHELLINYQPNVIVGVPTLFEALLASDKLDGVDLSFITCAISGGDSLSESLKRRMDIFLEAHGAKIGLREGYGLTETVTACCLIPEDWYKPNSVGVPFADMEFKIVTPNTADELPIGEDGEIAIIGSLVMLGYLNDQGQTDLALRTHGDGRRWLHTGDMGSMDEDGFVYFKQRLQRVIVSAGYTIYPKAIENAIELHPDVLMAAVVGVSDTYKKQVPKAYIQLNKGVERSDRILEEVRVLCGEHIAKYAVPKYLDFKADLPFTPVGKIDYTALEKEGAISINE